MSLAYLGLPFFGLAYRPLAYRGSNSMAQTGFTPILHYASGTASAVPDASFLTSSSNGAELAVNYTDGKLFYKDNAGAVQVLAWKTTPVTAGGTGLTSLTAGYVPFGSGTSALGNSSSFTYTTGTSTLAAPVISASTSMASAGNMLFSGTATRIQGDFSNVTFANKTAFQDKTTNNATLVSAVPNGTNTTASWNIFNNSDPTNAGYAGIQITSTVAQVFSTRTGSGTTLPLVFNVGDGGAEVARITTSGQFLVGVTSSGTIAGSISAVGFASRSGSGGSFSGNVYNIYWTGSAAALYIDGSSIGTINVTSDYRIKKNVVTQTANAVARINALRPVFYEIADVEMYKGDGMVREGFIAHELAAVIPSSVDGVKDGLTSDGKIQPQTLRLDPIIAVLTKAVQELSARVATLEAK
jgi:hypothetical protein